MPCRVRDVRWWNAPLIRRSQLSSRADAGAGAGAGANAKFMEVSLVRVARKTVRDGVLPDANQSPSRCLVHVLSVCLSVPSHTLTCSRSPSVPPSLRLARSLLARPSRPGPRAPSLFRLPAPKEDPHAPVARLAACSGLFSLSLPHGVCVTTPPSSARERAQVQKGLDGGGESPCGRAWPPPACSSINCILYKKSTLVVVLCSMQYESVNCVYTMTGLGGRVSLAA